MTAGKPATQTIKRLYIANRGEIAGRIAATAGRLGIEAIVPRVRGEGSRAGDADPGARTDAVDLLDAEAIVEDALAAEADSLHPGYGFLAESPLLAEAVLAAGLTWIGPPPAAIELLGDKARSRDSARSVDVPVAVGEAPDDQSDASLRAAVQRIGLPVLVKPAAGGGGKGIRVVRRSDDLDGALASARREATRAFGDDRLILERFVSPARHVEVQVLADRHGGVVHLGDRDCSLQRRNQKVLEEAPAPDLPDGIRVAIRAAAVRIAAAVGYENAGTCEFLVANDGTWVFLEMNARLQVEHPVTELILGRDLVADQVRLAEGARLGDLGLLPEAIEVALGRGGHAVEVRLNAEDPVNGFLPSAGRVVAVHWPPRAVAFEPVAPDGIRVDSVLAAGDEVTGAFDPLLAKIVAHAAGREAALDRLAAAVDETEVLGLVTNLALLRRLVRLELVRDGRARTGTLEALVRAAADVGPQAIPGAAPILEATPIPTSAWSAAAALLARRDDAGAAWGGGWRLNAPAALRLVADGPLGLEERVVSVGRSDVAEPSVPLAVQDRDVVHVAIAGRSVPFRLAPPPELDRSFARASGDAARGEASPSELVAPMPGSVLAVHVARGAAVDVGARIVTIEAMKMEHVVTAVRPGRVADLLVRPGDRVQRGQPLVRVEPAEPGSATRP